MPKAGNSITDEEKQIVKTLLSHEGGLNHQEILHFLARLSGNLYNSARITEIQNDDTIEEISDGELDRYIFDNLP